MNCKRLTRRRKLFPPARPLTHATRPLMIRSTALIALALFAVASPAWADSAPADSNPADSLQAGDPLGAFYVTKVAGADDDGVAAGDKLCYRCRYGNSPMAILFTRSSDDTTSQLARSLDQLAMDKTDENFRALVVLLGEDRDSLDQAAKTLATDGMKSTPVVVASENESGPLAYRIDPTSKKTLVIARDNQVETVLVDDDATADAARNAINALFAE